MKRFKAYTQATFNAEKFYIEDSEENDLVISAESEHDALLAFVEYIKENSLYSEMGTRLWLARHGLWLEEIAG